MKWSQKPLALAACAAFSPLLIGATPPVPLTHHYPVAGATTLALFLDGGDVHAIPQPDADGDVVTVVASINDITPTPKVNVARSGKNLNVTFTGGDLTSLPFTPQRSLGYEVRYPAHLRLQVVDQHGNVTVDSPESLVSIDADAGNVVVNDAHARVDAVADTGNATVELAAGWNADAVRMESTNGDIRLTLASPVHGELDATSEDGTVHNSAGDLITKAPLPVIFLITEKGDVWITPHAAAKP